MATRTNKWGGSLWNALSVPHCTTMSNLNRPWHMMLFCPLNILFPYAFNYYSHSSTYGAAWCFMCIIVFFTSVSEFASEVTTGMLLALLQYCNHQVARLPVAMDSNFPTILTKKIAAKTFFFHLCSLDGWNLIRSAAALFWLVHVAQNAKMSEVGFACTLTQYQRITAQYYSNKHPVQRAINKILTVNFCHWRRENILPQVYCLHVHSS